MSKYFGMGKQLLKEKMGTATSTVLETKEFLDSKEELFATQAGIKALIETTQSVFKHTGPETENPALAFNELIKKAIKCEADYRYAKLDLDAKNSSLAQMRASGKPDKVPVYQARSDQAAAVFDSARQALVEAIGQVLERRDAVYKRTIERVCEALQNLKPTWESVKQPDANMPGAETETASGTTSDGTTSDGTTSSAADARNIESEAAPTDQVQSTLSRLPTYTYTQRDESATQDENKEAAQTTPATEAVESARAGDSTAAGSIWEMVEQGEGADSVVEGEDGDGQRPHEEVEEEVLQEESLE